MVLLSSRYHLIDGLLSAEVYCDTLTGVSGNHLDQDPIVADLVTSGWIEFQNIAKVMLIAAGLSPASLLVADATRPGWKRGLTETVAVVCDAVTADELPRECFGIVFRLFDEASIARLREIEARVSTSSV